MADHRIRLDDDEVQMIVAALRARIAGVGRERAGRLARLADRLDEGKPGNPAWILGWGVAEMEDASTSQPSR